MRRLRGEPPHVPVARDHTGRTLVTRRIAVALSGRHPTVVHRAAAPVACDVATRVLLVDVDELNARLAERPARPIVPGPRTPGD